MTNLQKMVITGAVLGLFSGLAIAVDDPEEILNDVAEATLKFDMGVSSNEENWRGWVDAQQWGESEYFGGVQHYPERELIISSGVAYTNVRIGQPGWNEARMAAYERAELAAKSSIVSFLSESLENERTSKLLEKAQFSDGEIQEVQDVSETQQTLERLTRKGVALTDALLDSQISKLDENYDPAKFNQLSKPQQEIAVEQIFNRVIGRAAMRALIGVTPVFNAESVQGNQYEVFVGVIWSPKLNRLAASLANDVYNIPAAEPGRNINDWVKEIGEGIIGMVGSRVMIDENGDYSVVAFAQAEPRRSSQSRQESALRNAKDIAANRGRAMITNFVKETVAITENETSKEIFQEFEDFSTGAESIREFQQVMRGQKKTIKLSGIRTLTEWSMKHPETGQKVAGSVIVWSPSSRQMSKDIEDAMAYGSTGVNAGAQKNKAIQPSGKIIKSVPVETSAY